MAEVLEGHTRVVHRFAAACERGDLALLEEVLAADVLVVIDGGGKIRVPLWPIQGASEGARAVSTLLTCRPDTALSVEHVNGRMGLVLRQVGQAMAVVSLSVAGPEVTAVWAVVNPDKLSSWHRPVI